MMHSNTESEDDFFPGRQGHIVTGASIGTSLSPRKTTVDESKRPYASPLSFPPFFPEGNARCLPVQFERRPLASEILPYKLFFRSSALLEECAVADGAARSCSDLSDRSRLSSWASTFAYYQMLSPDFFANTGGNHGPSTLPSPVASATVTSNQTCPSSNQGRPVGQNYRDRNSSWQYLKRIRRLAIQTERSAASTRLSCSRPHHH